MSSSDKKKIAERLKEKHTMGISKGQIRLTVLHSEWICPELVFVDLGKQEEEIAV